MTFDLLERDLACDAWENEGGPAIGIPSAPLPPGWPFRAARGGVARFLNDVGSDVVTIGVRQLNCIGASPPADHPHVYLELAERTGILCPYCATRYRFDPALPFDETRPPDCFHSDGPWIDRGSNLIPAMLDLPR